MILSALGRMIVVPMAFVIASIVTLFVLLTLGYERVVHYMTGSVEANGIDAIFGLFGHGVLLASGLTILPALALVIVGEVVRIRSALYYVLGGGAAMVAIPLLIRFGQEGTGNNPDLITVWQVFATAGFAGGLVYWLVAGRKA